MRLIARHAADCATCGSLRHMRLNARHAAHCATCGSLRDMRLIAHHANTPRRKLRRTPRAPASYAAAAAAGGLMTPGPPPPPVAASVPTIPTLAPRPPPPPPPRRDGAGRSLQTRDARARAPAVRSHADHQRTCPGPPAGSTTTAPSPADNSAETPPALQVCPPSLAPLFPP